MMTAQTRRKFIVISVSGTDKPVAPPHILATGGKLCQHPLGVIEAGILGLIKRCRSGKSQQVLEFFSTGKPNDT